MKIQTMEKGKNSVSLIEILIRDKKENIKKQHKFKSFQMINNDLKDRTFFLFLFLSIFEKSNLKLNFILHLHFLIVL